MALVENLQREDLSPVEEARGYQALLAMGLTQEEVAKRVGKARSTVANALRLLQLPEEVLQALERGEITAGHARALLMLEPQDRLWGLGEILAKGLSVRQAEALPERLRREKRSREDAPLSLELSRYLACRCGWWGGSGAGWSFTTAPWRSWKPSCAAWATRHSRRGPVLPPCGRCGRSGHPGPGGAPAPRGEGGRRGFVLPR